MGNVCSGGGDGQEEEQTKRSRAIDRNIEEDSKKLRRECKILLLGGWSHGIALQNHYRGAEANLCFAHVQVPARAARAQL